MNHKRKTRLSSEIEDENSNSLKCLEKEVKKAFNKKNFKGALDICQKIIESYPENSRAYFNKAFALEGIQNSDYNQYIHIEGIEREIRENYGKSFALALEEKYNRLKRTLENKKKPKKTITYEELVSRRKKTKKLANSLDEPTKEKSDEETKATQSIPHSLKEESDALYESGEWKRVLNNHQEAIKDFTKAIDFNPNNPKIYYAMANCHFLEKNRNEALKIAEEGLKVDPSFYKLYTIIGYTKRNSGDPKGALEAFEKAKEGSKMNCGSITTNIEQMKKLIEQNKNK